MPSKEAISAIVSHVGERRLLEVGAGTGLWARLLSAAGLFVTAVDNYDRSWIKQQMTGSRYQVRRGDGVEAVKAFRDHQALMLCWPPYGEPLADNVLAAFEGDTLVYIGEGSHGCTGDQAFHRRLGTWYSWENEENTNTSEWEQVNGHGGYIPSWSGLHDALYLFRRQKG